MTAADGTTRAASPADAPRRIYVRMPNWVGDVVMATPAVRALRAAHPAAEITLGLRGRVADVLRGWSRVDRTWSLDRGEARPFGGLGAYVRRLRAERFDLAVLFTNSLGTALGPALARIPRRVGLAGEGRRALLTTALPRGDRRLPIPMPRTYGRIVAACGAPPAGEDYELPVAAADRDDATRRLAALGVDPRRPLALLVPGASFGASKLWAPDRFAAVGDALVRRFGAEVLVAVGPGEEAIGEAVVAAAKERLAGARDAVLPLATLRAVVERSALMVVNDTGPRFFAVALKKPVVCVMGPTHPGWSEWSMERQRVVRVDVPCGPCHKKTCPLDHACMTGVGVDAVLRAVDDLADRVAAEAASVAASGLA